MRGRSIGVKTIALISIVLSLYGGPVSLASAQRNIVFSDEGLGKILLLLMRKASEADGGKEPHQAAEELEILQSWQGDFPVAQLERFLRNQRERPVGYVADARTFERVWKAFKPDQDVPEVDFELNLVLFARNTKFYNLVRIGRVNLRGGVVEVLAMETMSAAPIEDKVAMSLVVVPRRGISGIQAGDEILPVRDNR